MMKKILVTIAIFTVFATMLYGCAKPSPQPSPSTQPSPNPVVSGSQSTSLPLLTTAPSPAPIPASALPPTSSLTSTPVPIATGGSSDVSPATLQSEIPLKVTQPADASTLFTDAVIVKGQTQPWATVNVNDRTDIADGLGNFSITVSLEDGPNAIDVITIDDNGRQGEVLLLVNVDLSQSPAGLSNNAPASTVDSQGNLTLKVISPVGGAILTSARVTVSGQTAPGATVIVDDQSTIADNNGNFSLPIDLNNGPNSIDVVAFDDDGNEGEVLLMVNVG